MKIRVKGLIGGSHSWAVVNRKIAESAIKNGHDLSISSINGYDNYQKHYNKYIDKFIGNIDLSISYTNPHNYGFMLKERSRCKVGISNYESSTLPPGWTGFSDVVDRVVVNSEYSRQNFISSGFREDKLLCVPLGTDVVRTDPYFVNDCFNFLCVSAPHKRKNIDQVVRCYYNAFSVDENVCLTIKTSKVEAKRHYNVDVFKIIKDCQNDSVKIKFPKIQVITSNVDDMSTVYSACDALISCSASEGFGLPMLEAKVLGLQVICPDYSGQKDFLNESSAFMVKALEVYAEKEYQYWTYNPKSLVCSVRDYDVETAMRSVFEGEKKDGCFDSEKYSWDNFLKSIISHEF